jgi:hypothetical protein
MSTSTLRHGNTASGSIANQNYVWNGVSGSDRPFLEFQKSIELDFKSRNVWFIVNGTQVAPVDTHGPRMTIGVFLYTPDEAHPEIERTELQTNANGHANTLAQAKTAYFEHLQISAWEKRQAEYRADVKTYNERVAIVFDIFRNRLGIQALSILDDEITAQDPVAAYKKLLACGTPTASQALGAAYHDLQTYEWTEGSLTVMQGDLARLEQTATSYPGETPRSEAARIAQVEHLAGQTHGPIFRGTIDRLKSGADDGTPYSLQRVWQDLKLVESSAAGGKVWDYRKTHLSEYVGTSNKLSGSTAGGKLKGSYLAALTEEEVDEKPTSETSFEQATTKRGGGKWGQKKGSGPKCPICEGDHRVFQCGNCKECPSCGWKYAKSTKGACPGPYHSSGKRAQGSRGGSRGPKRTSASAADANADKFASMAASIERLTQSVEDLMQERDEMSSF